MSEAKSQNKVLKVLLLDYAYEQNGSIQTFNEGLNSGASVGFEVVFTYFFGVTVFLYMPLFLVRNSYSLPSYPLFIPCYSHRLEGG